MESKKETLIIKEIAHQLSPDCKELLFGSKAMDESNTNSDYDIELIIIDKIDIIAECKEKKEYK